MMTTNETEYIESKVDVWIENNIKLRRYNGTVQTETKKISKMDIIKKEANVRVCGNFPKLVSS